MNIDISIITPVYNTGHFLLESVQSVLHQQPYKGAVVPNFEIIIVDDHSNDQKTKEILKSLSKLDSRIKVITNTHTKGASGARNTGIFQAQGKWIGFLDSDDLLLEHSLSYRWRYICNTQNVKWLATPFLLLKPKIGIEHKAFDQRYPTLYEDIKENYNKGKTSILQKPVDVLCKNCFLGTHTTLIQSEIIKNLDGFNETLKRAEDYELWLKLATKYDLHYLTEDTALYRIREGSLTRTNEPIFFYEDKMIEGLLNTPDFTPYKDILEKRLRFILLDYCYYYRNNKIRTKSIIWSSKLIYKFPLCFKSWKMLIASLFGR